MHLIPGTYTQGVHGYAGFIALVDIVVCETIMADIFNTNIKYFKFDDRLLISLTKTTTMSIQKDLPELIKVGLISQDTADRIREYYDSRNGSSTNRLFIVFGIIGAILIGLGVILILAHNWDEFSRSVKTILAFLPLFIGQALCVFSLIKRQDSLAWRESSAAFLFFAIGASISLISQIYNIPGSLSSFLLTWMLLSLPVIYIMRSSILSLLYLVGITYYACESGYWTYPSSESYLYWLLLILALPHYYFLYRDKPASNFMIFHNWIVPLSVIITLGTVASSTEEFMFIAYISLFGLFYMIGETNFFSQQKTFNNGFGILGSLGTMVLLLTLSFDWFWESLRKHYIGFDKIIASPEFYAALIVTLLAAVLLYFTQKNKSLVNIKPLAVAFILFIIAFIIGMTSSVAVLIINIVVFVIGILTIREGVNKDHLGILNYGLLIITALVICRFFDTDLSFVFRGILFMSVGAGFFAMNYYMLKTRKTNG